MTDSAAGMTWGDKGCVRDLSKCDHAPDDGCMWCCMKCNTDTHFCPGCSTATDHRGTVCPGCRVMYDVPQTLPPGDARAWVDALEREE